MATDWEYLSFREMNHCVKVPFIKQHVPSSTLHPISSKSTPWRDYAGANAVSSRAGLITAWTGSSLLGTSYQLPVALEEHSHCLLAGCQLFQWPTVHCLCLLSPPLTSGPIVSPGTTGDQTKQARGCLASNQDREVPSRPLSNVPTDLGWLELSLISSHPIPSLDLTDPNHVFISPSPRQLFILPLFLSSFLLASIPLPLRSTLPTLENTPD